MFSRNRGFTIFEVLIAVLIIAILAVVAVPAYMKYVRRAKTLEAVDNIDKMYKLAVAYYEAEHASASGGILAKTFPADMGLVSTPNYDECCNYPGWKCPPDPYRSAWKTIPTWRALGFSVDEAFYYSYSFYSGGSDATAWFEAEAVGDLDCDRTLFSTFNLHATADDNGNVRNEGLQTLHETE